jgi:nicotinamide-nucleotide amidase
MFPDPLVMAATEVLEALRQRKLRLATAESLTGGLIVSVLTEVAGSSNVVDRGFVAYSNAAKSEMLGVPPSLIAAYGAVSRDVAIAMAEGAVARSGADIAIAVTGFAGPGGSSATKPVGLVHLAAVRRGGPPVHAERRLGAIGRARVRLESVEAGLALIRQAMDHDPTQVRPP